MGLKLKPIISTLFLLLLFIIPNHITTACYTSIFAFGDSLTDVGNRLIFATAAGNADNTLMANPPYGETFFHHPTGRFCDGRIIVDFLAEYYGLPFMPPSASVMVNESSIEGGANFAVSGATVVDSAFYEERGIVNTRTNASLRVQMEWFKQLLPFFCATPSECKEKLKNSLIVLGPCGGNDYHHALLNGKDIEQITIYVPLVIDVISTAINDLIEIGATTIMVPGVLPNGCLPSVLTRYASDNKEDYDPNTGCLIWMNEFAEYHNQHLLQKLDTIRHQNPNVVIIYADLYNITMELYSDPEKYGFIPTLAACCGVGGEYNYDNDAKCGNVQVKSCPEPWRYIDWDGSHMTERANKIVSMALLDGTCTSPPINTLCNSSKNFTYYN